MTEKRRVRHAFRFKVGPEEKIMTHWARVVPGKRDIFLPLKAEHVRRSIELEGVGNTQTCSMAICAKANANHFPHKVEGFIDWFYSRAFIVSKMNKNGMPSECYVYEHSDGIGQMNDSPGGQRKLLRELEATENGERIIHLRPLKAPPNRPAHPKGHRDGSRTKTKAQVRGAKLRFAMATLGGVPS